METLKELVSRVLSVEKSSLNEDSSPQNIESWDSFNGILLVSELEKNFGVKFTTEEVLSVKNFKDIIDSLKRHNVIRGLDNQNESP